MSASMDWLATQQIIPNFQWIAGKGGRDNVITNVNIMDNPDTIRFLIGGELILSTGYFLMNDDTLRRNFIKNLSEKKCAGLGIALKRYLNQLPEAMIEEADRLNFPIISVPFEQNFAEISRMVYRKIMQDEMSDTETIYQMYRELNERIIHEHSLRDTLNTICHLVECPVILTNHRLEFWECSYPAPQNAALAENQLIFPQVEAERILKDYESRQFQVVTGSGWILFPIRDREKLLGFLCFTENTECFTTNKYNFIFSILSLLAIELVNNTLKQQSTLQKHNYFIRNILSGNLSEFDMVSQCNLYGFDYMSPRICAVIQPEIDLDKPFEERASILERFDFLIRGQISGANQMIYKFNYERNIILFFLSGSSFLHNTENMAKEFIRQLARLMDVQGFTCNIGVSECLEGIQTLKTSFLEAMDALQIGKKVHRESHIFQYGEDIIYHTLANSMSSPHLKNFYLKALNPLVEFDRQNNASLFETLHMYFKCGFSIKDTSEALYIHRNTTASRLEKIRELLPYDLSDFNDSAILLLSFYAYELLGEQNQADS